MFWKFIRWGGTLAILVLVLAALSQSDQKAETSTIQPAAEQPAANKNFNL
jgi:hypothetical protein